MDNNEENDDLKENLKEGDKSEQVDSEQNDRYIAAASWFIIPLLGAIFVWAIKETREKPFLFEHCRQSVVLGVLLIAISMAIGTMTVIISFAFRFAACIIAPISGLLGLGALILCIMMLIKALNGKMPEIPHISNLAKQYIK